ncbi:hypothetical protein JYU34_014555 [Plutella xylostella]|uniref:Uncharacterized protein n=1 Tax=Plutella xylostella TaxID=51655 RepID=A0ABQ7Q8Y9_PLUXY|nr:hypothetical protein JYU34_014555 [Plutella xylostella]
MLLLRCALVAALVATAAAAWQENVRPKVFAQLGEPTDSSSWARPERPMPVNSRNNHLNG